MEITERQMCLLSLTDASVLCLCTTRAPFPGVQPRHTEHLKPRERISQTSPRAFQPDVMHRDLEFLCVKATTQERGNVGVNQSQQGVYLFPCWRVRLWNDAYSETDTKRLVSLVELILKICDVTNRGRGRPAVTYLHTRNNLCFFLVN